MVRLMYAVVACAVFLATAVTAQEIPTEPVTLATVTRPPFSMQQNGADTGFSIELWQALMADIGRESVILRADSFTEMLDMVRDGRADAAAANISITSERESEMDFSQPIFAGGLQLMVPANGETNNALMGALMSRDLLLAVAAAFGLLFVVGMTMWAFERRRQPYFDLPFHKAMFPAFWWALNLLVNGGFEERQPKSAPGRVLAVLLVVGSLFLVSAFVARITTTMTVNAIQGSIVSVNDLYGKRVGTTAGSTAAAYLDRREVGYIGYDGLDPMIADFETDGLDAIVFDAPILAYYANAQGREHAQLVGSVFLPESYGIALPSGSALAEPLNQSLLKLRERGAYEALRRKWFGPRNGR